MNSVLCIGGFDPSGGAGLAADLKTLSSLGVHGYGVVTTLTAQNSLRFFSHTPVSRQDFRRQWQAVVEEQTPEVIKIGLIPNDEILEEISACLKEVSATVIFDPVLATSSGHHFHLNRKKLLDFLPQVDLLTPNLPEWGELSTAAGAVLIKGGHRENSEFSTDIFSDQTGSFELTVPRLPGNPRGTGCTLSAAIAGFFTQTRSLREAVVQAKSYVTQGFAGDRYLHHQSWPQENTPFPWIGQKLEPSPECGALGFYPVVDRSHWLEKLLPLGTTTAQLRVKDLRGQELENEIQTAVAVAKKYDCRLFINDFWWLAVKHQAYGVHLGQEDLQKLRPEEMAQIKKAGLRLGISTHSFEEAARAHTFSPSYVALGPIFETTAKKMKFGPQGLKRISIWKKILPYPLVAIGGMNIERGRLAYAAGADSVAMMSDVTQATDPVRRSQEWLEIGTL